jgi:hypothetical protein
MAHIECGIDGLGEGCIIEGGILQFKLTGYSMTFTADTGAKFIGITFRGAQTVAKSTDYINHMAEFKDCTFEENTGERILDLHASLFAGVTFNSCTFQVSKFDLSFNF